MFAVNEKKNFVLHDVDMALILLSHERVVVAHERVLDASTVAVMIRSNSRPAMQKK